jgi:hypothetical protein
MRTTIALTKTSGDIVQNYVLTYGTYDDTHIVGIFSTRELAERRILDDVFADHKIEAPSITEWEVDAEQAAVVRVSIEFGQPV